VWCSDEKTVAGATDVYKDVAEMLSSPCRRGTERISPMGAVHALKHGETVRLTRDPSSHGPEHEVHVAYHEDQSYGDNGKPVRGATVGTFTVRYPNGRGEYHRHGPQANTAEARRKGANPNAKGYAADQVYSSVSKHFATSPVFNDRRGQIG